MLIANNYPKTVSKGELVQKDAGSFDGIAGLTPSWESGN
jgi:hypothetical protein